MRCQTCGYDDHGTGDGAHVCEPMRIVVLQDDLAEKLDELAELGDYWKRHREKGRNPTAVRAALVMLAHEVAAMTANVELSGLRGFSRRSARTQG